LLAEAARLEKKSKRQLRAAAKNREFIEEVVKLPRKQPTARKDAETSFWAILASKCHFYCKKNKIQLAM
jgi:hypothetical protein